MDRTDSNFQRSLMKKAVRKYIRGLPKATQEGMELGSVIHSHMQTALGYLDDKIERKMQGELDKLVSQNKLYQEENSRLRTTCDQLQKELAKKAEQQRQKEQEKKQTADDKPSDKLLKQLQYKQDEVTKLRSDKEILTATLEDTKIKLQERVSECNNFNDLCTELKATLLDKDFQIGSMDTVIKESEAIRRKLHNTVQTLKGNIQVYCRVRPLLQHEASTHHYGADVGSSEGREKLTYVSFPQLEDEQREITLHVPVAATSHVKTPHSFSFDRVFQPQHNNADIFDELQAFVQSALDGYRVCIFAYGQTGSGKTHTMEGPTLHPKVRSEDADDDATTNGIIPRTVNHIFQTATALEKQGWSFSLSIQYVEVYNETFRDLLEGMDPPPCEQQQDTNTKTPNTNNNKTTSATTTTSTTTTRLPSSPTIIHKHRTTTPIRTPPRPATKNGLFGSPPPPPPRTPPSNNRRTAMLGSPSTSTSTSRLTGLKRGLSSSSNLNSPPTKFSRTNSKSTPTKHPHQRHHEVKQHVNGDTYITNVTRLTVKDEQVVRKALQYAAKRRSQGTTACNSRSSRSHSVFTLRIVGTHQKSNQVTKGCLNLVDLAGSERIASDVHDQVRLRETQHINKSLAALRDVISALMLKQQHIPYRNSKLTYMLADCLGGECKTLMFVNVSPFEKHIQESLCSLRFAAKVQCCDQGIVSKHVRSLSFTEDEMTPQSPIGKSANGRESVCSTWMDSARTDMHRVSDGTADPENGLEQMA
eukprot:TRINITY_DN66890_c4_g1_i1.p1 TRINITY_DN66890_c4_g1~~TRINITY_DN66890_c4_g1_i1.p1  ORF type:complete len:757 (-),score=116.05 TRINITY_DN66890_c4_g1_i1:66-2336(-)